MRVGDRLIDGSVRGRLERLRNQLVVGRPLGDPTHMAIRSDEITSIIKSAID